MEGHTKLPLTQEEMDVLGDLQTAIVDAQTLFNSALQYAARVCMRRARLDPNGVVFTLAPDRSGFYIPNRETNSNKE